jgi:ABC-2 type transport system ATP-binding protein
VGDAVIETNKLHKTYGRVEALRGLDLRVEPGSICGFLGRNGAGKTTTLKTLMGMVRPTGGVARVFGLDPWDAAGGLAIRRRVGFVSDDKDLYDGMSVDGLIRFTAGFFPAWNHELAASYQRRFALPAAQRVARLSRGMRTKLALLLAFSRGADLLLLDEATSGLDPVAAEEVLQAIVAQVATAGTTVFFSSHQLAEVEQIADHVVVIDEGRAVIAGALDEIRDRYRRIRLVFDGDAPQPSFRAPGVVRVRRDGRELTVLVSDGGEAILAEARALSPAAIDVTPTTLKEIFLDSVTSPAPGVEA